jgi:flavodoxin
MKTVIVYDSIYGNTEKIASAIGSAIADEVKVLRVNTANTSELQSMGLLIIGSPTQGGRPTQAIQEFLGKIPEPAIKSVNIAVFDTRLPTKLVGIFGYAAVRIADSLRKKGAALLAPPEGFFVKGKLGPLKEGELERAASWAKGMIAAYGSEQAADVNR